MIRLSILTFRVSSFRPSKTDKTQPHRSRQETDKTDIRRDSIVSREWVKELIICKEAALKAIKCVCLSVAKIVFT